MYGKKLTDQEIAARMMELRNLRRMHARDQTTKAALRTEIKELRSLVALQQAQLDKQAIQIAELQTMVFGRKRKPPTGHHMLTIPKLKAQPRTKASYRRPFPPTTAITAEVAVPLPVSCACGGSFDRSSRTIHERFVEDIPLPELTQNYKALLVTKYRIDRGVCSSCGRATAARTLGGQAITLGPNIRLLICHLVTVVGLSYAQVIHLCQSLYGLRLSDGEIANTLNRTSHSWLPAYEQLKADIRAAPSIHADETPWPIATLQGAGYGWVIADSNNPKSCFVLANSRGTQHAKRLLGAYTGIRITDDYGVYRSSELPSQQQLCWAHLYRAIRDLHYNQNLPAEQLPYVAQWHSQFAEIYEDLRLYLSEPYNEAVRTTQSQELWQRVQTLTRQQIETSEPIKLTKLKAQLLRAGQAKLFLCLTANTPCDNNRAERDLRQLVLKRKRSFGSKTEQGAQALATILSLCTTTWRMYPNGYFKQLSALG